MAPNIFSANLKATGTIKADLRSPVFRGLRRGVAVGWIRVIILVLGDALSVLLAWKLAVSLGTRMESPWTDSTSFLPIILAVEIAIIASQGLYDAGSRRRDYFGMVKAISLAEVVLLLIAFLYKPSRYISRSTFLLVWLLSIVFTCIFRLGMDIFTQNIRKRGAACYPIYLICDNDERNQCIQLIERDQCYSIRGISDPSALDKSNREEIFDQLRSLGIVEVFVTWRSIQNRLYLCWRFQTTGITLRILPTQPDFFFPKSELKMTGGVPCFAVSAPVIVGSDFWIKRCFDFCSASVLVLLLSPLYILISILIKLDSPGPIFFQQTRVGLHSRPFKVWKFRTMVTNADKLQATLEKQNQAKDGILFKMKDDPRITKVGKFLRSYSLDELPQLFNVLLGEMSLVGPRPLPIRDVERFEEKHFIRQEVLPGITGLWQVSGRSNITNFEDVLRLDLSYIENWSLLLDIKILLATVKVVLGKTGAY